MSTDQVAETPATEPDAAPVPAAPEPVVFATLKDAVAQLKPGDKAKLYHVVTGQGVVKRARVVKACSPSDAALNIIGNENITLVSPKEKYDAAIEALTEARSQTT